MQDFKINPHSRHINLTSWNIAKFHLCVPYCNIVLRRTPSRAIKEDINPDYGIYPENGDIVMEAVDRNTEYEQHATGGENQANGGQVYENKNWEDEYDKMYT